ncbi:MAG TPA: outer membrane protein [Pseudolabrys sp.]|nr:outer membrane protein [Pseudolabrys sp.]
MKRRLLGSVAVLPALFAGSAMAAEPMNWTGFYIGINAGGAWSSSKANTSVDCNSSAGALNLYFCSPGDTSNGSAVEAAGSGTIHASGFTGGLQLGYNWQVNSWILGVETDFGAFHLRGSRQGDGTFPTSGTPFTVNSAVSSDWLYTLRGRVGATVMPNLLAYATGGLALTRLKVNESYSDSNIPPGTGSLTAADTKTGWALGGGLEWALSNAWSVKVEYLHVDFGKVTASGGVFNPSLGGYGQGISTSADLTAEIARAGVNFKF